MKKIRIILLAVLVTVLAYSQIELLQIKDMMLLLDTRTNESPIILLQENLDQDEIEAKS